VGRPTALSARRQGRRILHPPSDDDQPDHPRQVQVVLRYMVVASLTGVVVWAQEDRPSLAEVLKAAGEYVATLERNASLVAQDD